MPKTQGQIGDKKEPAYTFVYRQDGSETDYDQNDFIFTGGQHSLNVADIVPEGAKYFLAKITVCMAEDMDGPYTFIDQAGIFSMSGSGTGTWGIAGATCLFSCDYERGFEYVFYPPRTVDTIFVGIIGWFI